MVLSNAYGKAQEKVVIGVHYVNKLKHCVNKKEYQIALLSHFSRIRKLHS